MNSPKVQKTEKLFFDLFWKGEKRWLRQLNEY